MVWAVPVSLAATKGIARNFFLNIMAQSTTVQDKSRTRCNASVQKESSLYCFLFLQLLRCFTSLGEHPTYIGLLPMTGGFPHSDISGSKVIWHLAETYRSHNTSFIAS